MYFIDFGIDAHSIDNAYSTTEQGVANIESVESQAFELWSKLSDGGFLGFVLISDIDGNILAAIRTSTPRFELPEDWHLTNR